MDNRVVAVVGVALCAGLAGCSSPPPLPPQPKGSLPPTTAELLLNGSDLGTVKSVRCNQVGWVHTIDTGDDTSGVTAVVRTQPVEGAPLEADGDSISAQSMQIRDLDGFTGSFYQFGDDANVGEATAVLIGDTYKVTGTVEGYKKERPIERVSIPFEFKANC